MQKAKKYDWKDSNLALFGSQAERDIKKESAELEPAWQGCGQEVGLEIWRIVKFEVVPWPKKAYGWFYSGDSYIILNTYHPDSSSEALAYDVHFWIGKHSTQDEYGTAAYKTVELDTYLDDVPVQHREVQGHESDMFKSYFGEITIMKGGADSGFNTVEPEEYTSRLLQFNGKGNSVRVNEVTLSRSKLCSDDVFILDMGLTLYQWNGTGANKDERFKAMQYLIKLKEERGGKCISETLDEHSEDEKHPFYTTLDEADAEESDEEEDLEDDAEAEHQLFRLSDEEGDLSFMKVKDGQIEISDFNTQDVFILDTGKMCFVWVGNEASATEKRNGFSYAHDHLKSTSHPLIPVVVLKEGQLSGDLETAMAA